MCDVVCDFVMLFSRQAMESASSFAAAYSIGKLESEAAINLIKHVKPWARDALKDRVR